LQLLEVLLQDLVHRDHALDRAAHVGAQRLVRVRVRVRARARARVRVRPRRPRRLTAAVHGARVGVHALHARRASRRVLRTRRG